MMTQLKNAYYGDINGTKQAYQPSKEADKYEIEFSVPQSYFTEDDYVITYCGSSVKSKDMQEDTGGSYTDTYYSSLSRYYD